MYTVPAIIEVYHLKTHYSVYDIPYRDIYYLEGDEAYTYLYFYQFKMQKCHISHNISYVLQEISHECFFQSHKGYVVGLLHVDHLTKNRSISKTAQILMTDGTNIECAYQRIKLFETALPAFRSKYQIVPEQNTM